MWREPTKTEWRRYGQLRDALGLIGPLTSGDDAALWHATTHYAEADAWTRLLFYAWGAGVTWGSDRARELGPLKGPQLL